MQRLIADIPLATYKSISHRITSLQHELELSLPNPVQKIKISFLLQVFAQTALLSNFLQLLHKHTREV